MLKLKNILSDRATGQALLAALIMAVNCLVSANAHAQAHQEVSESSECVKLLGNPRETFRNPADEIQYTNRYTGCWAESQVLHSKQSERSFLGPGIELFANPAAVEASAFSKNLCEFASHLKGYRADYPCWFERRTATQDVSMEVAARRESPKILFVNSSRAHDGSVSVEYILCTNDDPTKPKEYSKGCNRGKNMTLTQYGRGDMNGDHLEDVMVNIKYGDNLDEHKKCFMAAFTRKDGGLLHLISFSGNGLCE